jgi:AMMECR1 domain-containing protein
MSDPHDGGAGPAPGPADYAFACVGAYVAGGRAPEPPAAAFYERRAACFVTLKKHGELRGCIGTLEPAEALRAISQPSPARSTSSTPARRASWPTSIRRPTA